MVKRCIALGTFDGIHKGHRQLLDQMLAAADKKGLQPMIYTFSNHPLDAFGKAPKRIMKDSLRLEELGRTADVAAEEFTPELAAVEPGEFIRRMVCEMGMAMAVVGFNYTFGRGGAGRVENLREYGREYGFEVLEVPPALHGGAPVSSTRIRQSLEGGDVVDANAMLGREFSLKGQVVSNRRIGGSILGYPTANIPLDPDILCPAYGVYAVRATVRGEQFMAVTNIGRNPTVGGRQTTCETHIMDFEGDIYGEQIEVAFVERLRGEIVFPSVKELAEQIGRDAEKAAEILKK